LNLIRYENLNQLHPVDKGEFGIIEKGQFNQITVAVKSIIGDKDNAEEKMTLFLKEVDILQRLNHPNIITFLGVCVDKGLDNKWHIVLEWAENSSLIKFLQVEKTLSWHIKFQMCIDIALGMSWLHHRINPIIHFDLKSENILVMNDYTCKITDFGLSLISKMKNTKIVRGTCLYMAPEMLRRKRFEPNFNSVPEISLPLLHKIDVYSYGLILWEICTHQRVFMDFGEDEFERFYQAICERDVRPPITDDVPPVLEPIIKFCWSKDPTNRPDFLHLVPILYDDMIKFYLNDSTEITFWKSYFPHKFRVPFNEFVDKLWKHYSKIFDTSINECDFFSSLNDIIGSEKAIPFSQVSLLSYQKLIAWFGPLFTTRQNFIDLCGIMKKRWFFNTIVGGAEAEHTLKSNPQGSFIVRRTPDILQEDKIGYPFTIDYYFKEEIIHHRVARFLNGLYHIGFNDRNYENESIDDLIETLIKDAPDVFKNPVKLLNNVVYRKT